jgi:hypothetical protein
MTDYIKKRLNPKRESAFVKEFMEDVKKIKGSDVWFFKTHGEPMQAKGIPDILMCYFGLFVGIEFKIMRNGKLSVTPYQEYVAELIQKSNGISWIIWYDESNTNCGINMKRFETRKECVDFVLSVLDSYLLVPAADFVKLKN